MSNHWIYVIKKLNPDLAKSEQSVKATGNWKKYAFFQRESGHLQ